MWLNRTTHLKLFSVYVTPIIKMVTVRGMRRLTVCRRPNVYRPAENSMVRDLRAYGP